MEFLKEIFADQALSYEQLAAAVAEDNGIELINLREGRYVEADKYSRLEQQKEELQKELKDTQEKLTADCDALKAKMQADMTAAADAKAERTRKEQALQPVLEQMKVRSLEAASAVIDWDKVILEGDEVKVFDRVSFARQYPYLVEIETNRDEGTGHQKGNSAGSLSWSDKYIAASSLADRVAVKQAAAAGGIFLN